jgi:DNA helicase HerA-like ATPase
MTGTRTQAIQTAKTNGRTDSAIGRRVLRRITCPHCWEQFAPERILWISEHSDLLGDPRLGPEHQQRFLPTRFTVAGEAIDGKGFACHSLACPKCHLGVPWALLEMEPLFFSIFGAPASGKSFFLAAMAWELRKTLPLTFSI